MHYNARIWQIKFYSHQNNASKPLLIVFENDHTRRGEALRRFFTPSGVRSAWDRHSLHRIWCQTLDPRTPFYSKQIRWTCDPGLLRSQSTVPNLCFRELQPFLVITLKKKSTRYSILSLQVASLSSATSCC